MPPLTRATLTYKAAAGGMNFYMDDSQLTTTSTSLTTLKNTRFVQGSQNLITLMNFYISIWNATSSATTTVAVFLDGAQMASTTTTQSAETLVQFTDISVPTVSGFHNLEIKLSTSNASYSAYTKWLQIYGK